MRVLSFLKGREPARAAKLRRVRQKRIAAVAAILASLAAFGCPPVRAAKSPLVVGFAQTGAESGWRTANTDSIKSAAAADDITLKFSDAQSKQENQIKALKAFLAQHVDVIAFSPIVETGFEPVLRQIKAAHIPVILSDRVVKVSNPDLYSTFIGSDFVEEGRRAGDWLAKKTGGKAVIAEIEGTPGSAPANDRKKGFDDAIAKYPGMKVVLSQSGDFNRAKGKEVMEAFLKNPVAKGLTAVYAHNDDMALGAIQAMQEAGRDPGKSILVVSIDGVKDAFKAMVAGTLNCTVECNPLLGPDIMKLAEKLHAGDTVPHRVVSKESVYDQSDAARLLPSRKY